MSANRKRMGGPIGFLMDKGKPKYQLHETILALDLITLIFDCILTIVFFRFNPIVTEGLI